MRAAPDEKMVEFSLNIVDADGKNSAAILTERHAPQQVRLWLFDWR